MPDLIAQGIAPQHRWRRSLPKDRVFLLGRDAGFWSAPWDSHISRSHAELRWHDGQLEVRGLPQSRNPIFFRGQAASSFKIRPGEHFVIGDTTFSLVDQRVRVSLHLPRPVSEQTFSAEFLKAMRFRDADQRIDALGRIPEIISGAVSDQEMFVRLVSILLSGIPQADAVALVCADTAQADSPVCILHWDQRRLTESGLQPSESLIRRAVETGESVVHIWSEPDPLLESLAPHTEEDWAYCTPLSGACCRGWSIYVAGRFRDDRAHPGAEPISDLRDDLKFTEVVASTVGNLRQARVLERNQASLRQFLSPIVLEALAGRDPDQVLAPRETDVSVLFCDLRGFARHSEHSADDLLGLLRRVSDALGVMTRWILEEDGVVGDFHGDAAMGFWGWPLPQNDAVERACRAALAIRAEFVDASQQAAHPLADFRFGMGLATGTAVAGKIGTVDQVKVTVFGPAVNRAARLEGMTKQLHAPILLDKATADVIRARVSPAEARVRRVAVVQPYGLDVPLEVSELLPPAREEFALCDDAIRWYEDALDALLEGRWQESLRLLHRVPAEDQVKDFLMVFIARHDRVPPVDWDGVIPLAFK
ncbi:MAG: adenylate/guanylate cyclase domain-containing protein, partial [Planctomycetes bacterium]|nr:adenylate/guanylate cyclase domain-containing protein [Planctomycetota bacterium]